MRATFASTRGTSALSRYCIVGICIFHGIFGCLQVVSSTTEDVNILPAVHRAGVEVHVPRGSVQSFIVRGTTLLACGVYES